MKKAMLTILAVVSMVSLASAALTATYGWEDGNTILGSYGDITAANVTDVSYEGTHSLYLLDGAASGTPQAYVGWVTGLNDGDTVTAGFWVYDDGTVGSGRIWGHYSKTDVNSYGGSAGGNNTYSTDESWSYLEHTWTFDSDGGDRNGIVIEARTYSVAGAYVWFDTMTITAPDYATIETPGGTVPEPATMLLLGLGAISVIRRK